MKKIFTPKISKYIQKIFAHKIGLLNFISIWLLIDYAAIYYVELNPISVSNKTLLPLAAVNILCFFIFLFYILKANTLKKWITIASVALLPIADFFLVEGMLGHLGKIFPIYYVYNIIVYSVVLLMLILFFQDMRCSLFVFHGFVIAVTLVNYYVYKLRGRPFMVQDVWSAVTAARVAAGYSFDIVPLNAIYLTIMFLLLGMIIYLPAVRLARFHVARKIMVVAGSIAAAFLLTDDGFMNRFPAMSFNQFDIEGNYEEKGYIMALLSEMRYCRREAPENYAAEDIEQIVDRYLTDTSQYSPNTKPPVNLIVIMNESWADLRVIGSFETDDTIMPYMDCLTDNTIKGFLHMPVYGNGTANSEYEVLTGNSMHFIGLLDTPYQLFISDPEYGMTSTVKAQGYRTIVLHPNIANNWNRSLVYPRMQFDKFYALDDDWPKEYQEAIRWCVSDRASYDMLIEQYETKNSPDELLFSFLVTIQNHGGYDWKDYEPTVQLDYSEHYPLTEQYLSLIRETDAAFQYLIEYFTAVDEPTMIVMFGDHFPHIEESFYEMLLGYNWNECYGLDHQKFYTTPFIIWANYDIEEESNVEMSSNYFGSYILQLAGLEMSDYQRCVLAFAEEMPVIGMGMVMDHNGNWYGIYEMPDRFQQIYRDYEFLQYNNVFDKRNRMDRLFTIN